MSIEDTVKDSVRRAMADDYESFALIVEAVNNPDWVGMEGLNPTIEQVVQALRELIEKGEAQAYVLSPHKPHVTEVAYSEDRVNELWYYLTPKGMEIVSRQNPEMSN